MIFDLQLFAEFIEHQTPAQLRKGIRSFKRRIAEHQHKIENPWTVYEDWFSAPEQQRGRIKHWQHELQNFEESVRIRIDELAKRGERP